MKYDDAPRADDKISGDGRTVYRRVDPPTFFVVQKPFGKKPKSDVSVYSPYTFCFRFPNTTGRRRGWGAADTDGQRVSKDKTKRKILKYQTHDTRKAITRSKDIFDDTFAVLNVYAIG